MFIKRSALYLPLPLSIASLLLRPLPNYLQVIALDFCSSSNIYIFIHLFVYLFVYLFPHLILCRLFAIEIYTSMEIQMRIVYTDDVKAFEVVCHGKLLTIKDVEV